MLIVSGDCRVFNGVDVLPGEIPWQVSVQLYTGFHWCGGSIIGSNVVLTAAHCQGNWGAESLRVVSGTINSDSGTIHKVSQIINHEAYDELTHANDIALWKIEGEFVWDNQTRPVDLPPQGLETPEGSVLTISGFRSVSSNPEPLQKIEIPVVSFEACNATYTGQVPTGQLCAGVPEQGLSSCQGDEGGPLFLGTQIRGIASWGSNCGFQASPGVYLEVAAYRDWILANIGI
ncbi:Hypothetical predicted protein [Cloeon dipterum]|uniref:Peptidase S1 domain-containing protein n=1 Tax=Cloeon dipterum TaxID=197152 RepID=A0A8S1CL04_9INSE|nr:Hypothetical predicted protein [Cloeon dipterum]